MKKLICKIFGHKERKYEPLAVSGEDWKHNNRILYGFERYCTRCHIPSEELITNK